MSEIKMEKVTIALGDKSIELTIEQAKELHKILSDTFNLNEKTYIPSPYPYPVYPSPYPYWRYWDVTYYGTTAIYTSSSRGDS